LFIGSGEDDSVVEGGRLLQGDVSSQGIAQADDEELDLQWLGEGGVTARQGHELFGIVIDGAGAAQHHQSADGAIGEGRLEAGIYQLYELQPCRPPAVEF
jgi:hypothetical protein